MVATLSTTLSSILAETRTDIEDRRRRLRAWITVSAREAARNPAVARRYGIAPVSSMSLFSPPAPDGVPSAADWMRGAVAAMLPPGWSFQIITGADGHVTLRLGSFDGPSS